MKYEQKVQELNAAQLLEKGESFSEGMKRI